MHTDIGGNSDSSRNATGDGVSQAVGAAFGDAVPSFLVHNVDNVNAQLHGAGGLLTMWDFLEHKGRIGRTKVILNRKNDRKSLKVMPATCKSRYFDDGRLNMSYGIMARLGKFNKVPGLMGLSTLLVVIFIST